MHRPPTPRSLSLVLYLAGCLAVLGGCANNPHVAAEAITSAYPAEAQYGPDLDVVLVRDGKRVRLVNREARSFGPGELWLNGAYMRPVERIDIGSGGAGGDGDSGGSGGNALPLAGFHNGFGERYPTGSFLRPERNRRLVLAELYDPQAKTRYRLTVQPEEQPGTN